jgi:hypothetical protein
MNNPDKVNVDLGKTHRVDGLPCLIKVFFRFVNIYVYVVHL